MRVFVLNGTSNSQAASGPTIHFHGETTMDDLNLIRIPGIRFWMRNFVCMQ